MRHGPEFDRMDRRVGIERVRGPEWREFIEDIGGLRPEVPLFGARRMETHVLEAVVSQARSGLGLAKAVQRLENPQTGMAVFRHFGPSQWGAKRIAEEYGSSRQAVTDMLNRGARQVLSEMFRDPKLVDDEEVRPIFEKYVSPPS